MRLLHSLHSLPRPAPSRPSAPLQQALKLGEVQQEQLLALRRAHLANLRSLYEARQDLNLEAMSLMLLRRTPPELRVRQGQGGAGRAGAGSQGERGRRWSLWLAVH